MAAEKKRILAQMKATGTQVTPLREQVLDIVLQLEGVIKAYHVLSLMQQQSSANVAPPTAYRALDFWAEQGVLHKVAAVNGYVVCRHAAHDCDEACAHDKTAHSAFILVCSHCGATDEQSLAEPWRMLNEALATTGFELTEKHVVLTGMCQQCRK